MMCQWAPSGMPEAEGCSGSSTGVAPVVGVSSARLPFNAPLEVATDGFFVLEVGAYGLTSAEVAAALQVTATHDGQPLAGSLSLLSEPDFPVVVGWVADDPLAVGSTLSVTVLAGSEETSYELSVVGEPTPLAASAASLDEWYQVAHGVGATIKCARKGFAGACSPSEAAVASLPEAEEVRDATDVRWSMPSTHGFVAWRVRLELVEGEADAVGSWQFPMNFYGRPHDPDISAELAFGRLMFPAESSDHCVKVVIEDVRTHDEVVSEPECLTRAAKPEVVVDTMLEVCLEPPNAALTARWCSLHPESTLPACSSGGGEGGAPTGEGPHGPEAGRASAGSSSAGATTNNAAETPSESSACSVSAPGAGNAGWLSVLGAALALGLHRRRRVARQAQ